MLLVVCCLLSSGRMVFKTVPSESEPDDIAARSDKRFALVKARLPTDGVVGYIGENGESAVADYYLTQYALCPLVVDDSAAHTIVIGNFPSKKFVNIPPDLRVVQDFGNGVLLLAGRGTK